MNRIAKYLYLATCVTGLAVFGVGYCAAQTSPGLVPPNQFIAGPATPGAQSQIGAARPIVAADLPNSVARIKLTAPITLYVSSTGNDSNTGLTAGSPWLHIAKCWSYAQNNIDFNGITGNKCQLLDTGSPTTYNETTTFAGPLVGLNFSAGFVVSGNCTTPGNVVLNGAIQADDNAQFGVQCMDCNGEGSPCINATRGGSFIVLNGGIRFLANANCDINVTEGAQIIIGQVVGTAGLTYLAGTHYAWACAQDNGLITVLGNPTIAMSGAVVWGSAGIIYQTGGIVSIPGMTFTGSATGQRFAGYDGGSNLNTATGNPDGYLPGSTNGTLQSGACRDSHVCSAITAAQLPATGVACSGSPTSSFATVSGIVTHC